VAKPARGTAQLRNAKGNRPKSRTPRIPRGEGREALCRALIRVAARDGFDGVTFRSVAAEAGVTHGLASYHFGTREAMIHEALTWATRNAISDAGLAQTATNLDDFAADLPDLMSRRPEDAIFQFQLAIEAFRREELLDDVRESYDGYIDAVRQSLVRFGLPDDVVLASVVFAMVDGLNLQHLIYGDTRRTRRSVRVIRELLHGLAERSPPFASRATRTVGAVRSVIAVSETPSKPAS
jgi:TetR/AcrR family transcriptional regulator, regulator of biofilm formation and stress response